MDETPAMQRLRAAKAAIAALIHYDNLPYHLWFQTIEREIASKTNGSTVEAIRAMFEDTPAEAPAPEPEEKRSFNSREAAAYIGTTVGALDMNRYNHAHGKGELLVPYTKDGRSVVYRKADLDAFLAKATEPEDASRPNGKAVADPFVKPGRAKKKYRRHGREKLNKGGMILLRDRPDSAKHRGA